MSHEQVRCQCKRQCQRQWCIGQYGEWSCETHVSTIKILELPDVRSFLNFLLYLATEAFTAVVKAAALLALGKNGSPVKPK